MFVFLIVLFLLAFVGWEEVDDSFLEVAAFLGCVFSIRVEWTPIKQKLLELLLCGWFFTALGAVERRDLIVLPPLFAMI